LASGALMVFLRECVDMKSGNTIIKPYQKEGLNFFLKRLFFFISVISISVCFGLNNKPNSKIRKNEMKNQNISFGTWTQYLNKSDAELLTFIQKYKDAGITHYFIHANPQQLKKIVALTKNMGINIHGWIWTLNRPGDKVAMENPGWYSVNRNGQNSYDFRPYVDYYQWLSPFSQGAREHIKELIHEIAEIDGLASVHLDYVRYSDVILPVNLQPKYGLVQNNEMPQFDFGYHPEARKRYKEIYDIDPFELEHPELNRNWLEFRLDAVTSLVNDLVEIAHMNGTKLSAAVFPFPEISRRTVRQDWSAWNLDIACPMNYHHFYNEDLDWIKFSVENGVKETGGRFDYFSGLFVNALTPQELKLAITKSIEGGANGINFFSIHSLTDEHLDIIRSFR
jgi:uncharacterized lipoprotein YddW (UPF0748 family)